MQNCCRESLQHSSRTIAGFGSLFVAGRDRKGQERGERTGGIREGIGGNNGEEIRG